jgi:hypothetical protein
MRTMLVGGADGGQRIKPGLRGTMPVRAALADGRRCPQACAGSTPTARSTKDSVARIARSRAGCSSGIRRRDVLLGEVTAGDAGDEDLSQDLLDHDGVLAQALLGAAGQHSPQVWSWCHVEHALEPGVRLDVGPQAQHGGLDVFEGPAQRLDVALGLEGDETHEQGFFVREVVVDGGPSDTGCCGDVSEGDRVETTLRHEGGQCREESLACLFAVLVE